jgi:hypothetical protein
LRGDIEIENSAVAGVQELQNGMREEIRIRDDEDLGLSEKALSMEVRDKEPADQTWVENVLTERWGGLQVIAHNEIFDAHLLPALIAGEKLGLATFRFRQMSQIKVAELITLNALTPQHGVGTALVEALVSKLRAEKGHDATGDYDQRQSECLAILPASRVSADAGSSGRGRRGAPQQAIDSTDRRIRYPDP